MCWFQVEEMRFLKIAIEVAEGAASRRLIQREGMQERNALAPALVLTLWTDKVIPIRATSINQSSYNISIVPIFLA